MKKIIIAIMFFTLLVLSVFSIEYEKKASPFSIDLLGGVNFPLEDLAKGWNMGFNFEGRFCYRYSRFITALLDIYFDSCPAKIAGTNAQTIAFLVGCKLFLNKYNSGFYLVMGLGLGYLPARSYEYYSPPITHHYVTVSEKGTVSLLGGGGWTFPMGDKFNFFGEIKLLINAGGMGMSIPASLGFSLRL